MRALKIEIKKDRRGEFYCTITASNGNQLFKSESTKNRPIKMIENFCENMRSGNTVIIDDTRKI